MVVIAPYWPNRPWFPLLTQLSFQDPVPLPLRPDLLSQGAVLHPCPVLLRLMVWFLRGRLEILGWASGVISIFVSLRRASTNKGLRENMGQVCGILILYGKIIQRSGSTRHPRILTIWSRSGSVHKHPKGSSLSPVSLLRNIMDRSPSNPTGSSEGAKIPQVGSLSCSRLTCWT